MSSKNGGPYNMSLFSLFSLRSTQGMKGKQGCFCHFACFACSAEGKDDAAGGGALGGDGTAESGRMLLIPTGYHSTRPPFVHRLGENANDSG